MTERQSACRPGSITWVHRSASVNAKHLHAVCRILWTPSTKRSETQLFVDGGGLIHSLTGILIRQLCDINVPRQPILCRQNRSSASRAVQKRELSLLGMLATPGQAPASPFPTGLTPSARLSAQVQAWRAHARHVGQSEAFSFLQSMACDPLRQIIMLAPAFTATVKGQKTCLSSGARFCPSRAENFVSRHFPRDGVSRPPTLRACSRPTTTDKVTKAA